jgi:hypothetical protein
MIARCYHALGGVYRWQHVRTLVRLCSLADAVAHVTVGLRWCAPCGTCRCICAATVCVYASGNITCGARDVKCRVVQARGGVWGSGATWAGRTQIVIAQHGIEAHTRSDSTLKSQQHESSEPPNPPEARTKRGVACPALKQQQEQRRRRRWCRLYTPCKQANIAPPLPLPHPPVTRAAVALLPLRRLR